MVVAVGLFRKYEPVPSELTFAPDDTTTSEPNPGPVIVVPAIGDAPCTICVISKRDCVLKVTGLIGEPRGPAIPFRPYVPGPSGPIETMVVPTGNIVDGTPVENRVDPINNPGPDTIDVTIKTYPAFAIYP